MKGFAHVCISKVSSARNLGIEMLWHTMFLFKNLVNQNISWDTRLVIQNAYGNFKKLNPNVEKTPITIFEPDTNYKFLGSLTRA